MLRRLVTFLALILFWWPHHTYFFIINFFFPIMIETWVYRLETRFSIWHVWFVYFWQIWVLLRYIILFNSSKIMSSWWLVIWFVVAEKTAAYGFSNDNLLPWITYWHGYKRRSFTYSSSKKSLFRIVRKLPLAFTSSVSQSLFNTSSRCHVSATYRAQQVYFWLINLPYTQILIPGRKSALIIISWNLYWMRKDILAFLVNVSAY